MKPTDNPCKRDCPERSPTCHSTCPKYATYREKLNEKNALINKKREENRRLDDAEVARHRRK